MWWRDPKLPGYQLVLAAMVAVACLFSGCSGEDGPTLESGNPPVGGGDVTDLGPPTNDTPAQPEDALDPPSDPGETTGGDTDTGPIVPDVPVEPDTPAVTEDSGPDSSLPPGMTGCAVDADCPDGGWCTDTPDGKVCTTACDDGACPDGWICGLISEDFFCVPVHSTLCDPCTDSAHCVGWLGSAACVVFGDAGSFCGSGCDLGCPDGFLCSAVPRVDGTIGNHCIPKGGAVCGCSPKAAAAGLSTTCSNSGAGGSCEGVRSCSPDGLGPCSAAIPSPEVCGGGDEDCDGQVDEPEAGECTTFYADADKDGYGDDAITACLCSATPELPVTVAGDCDDQEPDAHPNGTETCNGIDDDCDGLLDPEDAFLCTTYYRDHDEDGFGQLSDHRCLCSPVDEYTATGGGDCNDDDPTVFPDKPCGIASCNIFMITGFCGPDACGIPEPPKPCPNGFVCLSGTACRTDCTSDAHCQPALHCESGECVSDKPDGSPCAFDAQCASGHCANASGGSDGGGFCCAGGACCGGQDLDCDDSNPCTAGTCSADFTCAITAVEGSCGEASCDGLVFTPGATCVDGECVGGATEACSGKNPCHSYGCSVEAGCTVENAAAGTLCAEASCIGFEQTAATTCDGAGSCSDGGEQSPCPSGLSCDEATGACLSGCASSADCQPDSFCQGQACVEKLAEDSPCTSDAMCASDNCAGGLCCDGCCDTQTLGTDQYTRAMELCGVTNFEFQGKNNCARVIDEFGQFGHQDHSPGLGDTAMLQLSTGVANKTGNQQQGENQNTNGADPDSTVNGNVYDLCGFTATLTAPPTAKGFAFDFIFFSAEYPEWVGTQFNDTFNAMLSSTVYDNQNVAFDSQLHPISINVAFFTICDGDGCTQPESLLAGTGYDDGVGGSTGWLTTTVPIIAGETFTLRLVIYDEGDHIYDSDVLINNFRWVEVLSGTGPVTE